MVAKNEVTPTTSTAPPAAVLIGPAAPSRTIGSYLGHLYFLRVPLLTWLLLVAFPCLAVPPHARFEALLRGIFDISGRSPSLSLLSYGLVTLACFLTGMTIGVTARLILVDGPERFGVAYIPRRPGVRLLFRIIPLGVLPGAILAGVCWEAHVGQSPVAWYIEAGGIVLGFVAFLATVYLNEIIWVEVVERKAVRVRIGMLTIRPRGVSFRGHTLADSAFAWKAIEIGTRLSLFLAKLPADISPPGYVDANGQLYTRHKFAALQLLISIGFYLALFGGAMVSLGSQKAPVIPTLCLLLVLVMLICWGLSALTFFLDRFRIPLISILTAYAWLTSGVPGNDHFFRAQGSRPTEPLVRPDELLARWANKPVVLVSATGGGIQAEAWTARVLFGLTQDFEARKLDFPGSVALVSSVSGGSVGTMFFLDAYAAGKGPAVGADLDAHPALRAAEASSLDSVAWGLVYPDLAWSLAPWLKGISFVPPRLINGAHLTNDRGTVLEKSWAEQSDLREATLASWQADVRRGIRPAVIFNATIVETGQRLLLSTCAMGDPPPAGPGGSPSLGRLEFREGYPGMDVPVVTAARLSATFPYVTPAARIWRGDVFAADYHVVDGGYYDNYGVATLVEWLDSALRSPTAAKPSKVILLQIRAAAPEKTLPPRRSQGWFFQALQPLQTLESVRGTAQLSRNEVAIQFITRAHEYAVPVESATFEYTGDQDGDGPSDRDGEKNVETTEAPLSWHLTEADKQSLRRAWNRLATERRDFARRFSP